MNLAEQTSLTQSLLDQPFDQRALFAVYEAVGKDPRTYASLLEGAAGRTDQNVAASHWLTEAARVKLETLGDERGSIHLLEAALERDPLNMRAAEHLVDLYRNHREDEELAAVLRTRAAALHDHFVREPTELPRAALAFEKLSGVYEAIGDTAGAISALRTALEIERARARHTTPSPPPDVWPESSLRELGGDVRGSQKVAPPPEERWSAHPESDQRDTLRSPVPENHGGGRLPPESAREPSVRPPPEGMADPLLAVIEALHALRRSEDVVQGASLVLRTALEAIPSAAGFVHVSDVGTRDFVIVAAAGERHAEVIGTRAAETDPLLRHALEKMQAVTADAANAGWFTGSRFRPIHPSRQVLCAPVHFDGRHLGAIELVDPTRRGAFTDADRHAMTYVGERLGEFFADRSLTF